MLDPNRIIRGVKIPSFFYGTAWKEEETERLTLLALEKGFRGIDTANQRKHYHEAAVGKAIVSAIRDGLVSRDDLFLQTKFTFLRGQDHRLPYDPKAAITKQVEQSFSSSLDHLRVEVIDSFLLHGPTNREGLTAPDWEAWRAMEAIHDSGRTRLLGVSNVTLEQLEALCQGARVRPSFVQNRCYAVDGWDRGIRTFCSKHGLIYQGFSLLTANRGGLNSPPLIQIANRYQRTVQQIIFRFALQVGMLPLTGTRNPEHMREDLGIFDFELEAEEVNLIEGLFVG